MAYCGEHSGVLSKEIGISMDTWAYERMNTEIACFRFGDVHVIPVTCPEIAREFLKKQDATFMSTPFTMGTEYTSCGFLSTTVAPSGDQWKKMKRVVASAVINPSRLRWLLKKRTEEADNLVRYVHNQCISGAIVDVRVAVRQYSGNVIRKMMFNKRYFGEGRMEGLASKKENTTMHSSPFFMSSAHFVYQITCLA
ncbi:hypothetical protein NE237_016365 [Protea cynaroides]|uniref:Cytochrome P450 n=1 Tax=Protea cynaroides TaxID=273540 RepID=A0A9Q0GKQ9_9MAGN|nr:hypothetical protein NE237_016365 [Protea cynaroides]